MREVKYRVWDIAKEKMIQLEILNCPNVTYQFAYTNGILMQYTGIKDMNGKEVYEGDILKIHRDRVYPQVVEFSEGMYHTDEFALFELIRNKERTFEVIGNVYENPDLCE